LDPNSSRAISLESYFLSLNFSPIYIYREREMQHFLSIPPHTGTLTGFYFLSRVQFMILSAATPPKSQNFNSAKNNSAHNHVYTPGMLSGLNCWSTLPLGNEEREHGEHESLVGESSRPGVCGVLLLELLSQSLLIIPIQTNLHKILG
jgi:hypothetical protein